MHTIKLDDKEISISEESYEAFKKQFSEENKVWKPVINTSCYVISTRHSEGYIGCWWDDDPGERVNYNAGLAFKTEQEVKDFLEYQTAKTKIDRYIIENDLSFEPDWKDRSQSKWVTTFEHNDHRFCIGYHAFVQEFAFWYFKSEKDAQEIIDNFDKELRLLFRIK